MSLFVSLKAHSHCAFFPLATWFFLSQQMGCTELNGIFHTLKLRKYHKLLYSPLQAKTNRSCNQKNSHSFNGFWLATESHSTNLRLYEFYTVQYFVLVEKMRMTITCCFTLILAAQLRSYEERNGCFGRKTQDNKSKNYWCKYWGKYIAYIQRIIHEFMTHHIFWRKLNEEINNLWYNLI